MKKKNTIITMFCHPVMTRDGYRLVTDEDLIVNGHVVLTFEPSKQVIGQTSFGTIVALSYKGVWRWRKLSSVTIKFEDGNESELAVESILHPQCTPAGFPRQAFYVIA